MKKAYFFYSIILSLIFFCTILSLCRNSFAENHINQIPKNKIEAILNRYPNKNLPLGTKKLSKPLNINVKKLIKMFPGCRHLKISDGSEYILNQEGLTILMFAGKTKRGFTSIYSPLSVNKLKRGMIRGTSFLSENKMLFRELRNIYPKPSIIRQDNKVPKGLMTNTDKAVKIRKEISEGINITLSEYSMTKLLSDSLRPDVFPGKIQTMFSILGTDKDIYIVDKKTGMTLILFKCNENGKIVSIYSSHKAGLLRNNLILLSSSVKSDTSFQKLLLVVLSLIEHIKDNDKVKCLTIPEKHNLIFDKKETKRMMQEVLEYGKKEEKAAKVCLKDKFKTYSVLPASKKHYFSGSPSEVLTVVQREFGVISKKTLPKRVVNTNSASGSCVGIALYDSINQVAGLSHIDGITNISSVDKIISRMQREGARLKNIQAILFTAGDYCPVILLGLINFLEQQNIKIIEIDLKCPNMGISIEGKLFGNNFEDNSKDLKQRMKISGLATIPQDLTEIRVKKLEKNKTKCLW